VQQASGGAGEIAQTLLEGHKHMTFLGLRRGDLMIHGINGGDEFGLRWHRLLFPVEGMPVVHLGPLSPAHIGPTAEANDPNAGPPVYGHAEPTLSIPIDANSVDSGDPASGGTGASTDGVPATLADDETGQTGDLTPVWHAPYFSNPLSELHLVPPPPAGDAAPPAGFIPKPDAITWSGPAIMAFPPDAHDTGGVDLGAAFLPPGSDDLAALGHGLDPVFAFAPPPLPPPPDIIG
jgi:hypothetical protein